MRTSTFGPAYDESLDGERIKTQMLRVRDYMLQNGSVGPWRTLGAIKEGLEHQYRCRFPESSISAQLRSLKKDQFGGYTLEKRRVLGGLWEYRLSSPSTKPPEQLQLGERHA